jgi:hypothetical protein
MLCMRGLTPTLSCSEAPASCTGLLLRDTATSWAASLNAVSRCDGYFGCAMWHTNWIVRLTHSEKYTEICEFFIRLILYKFYLSVVILSVFSHLWKNALWWLSCPSFCPSVRDFTFPSARNSLSVTHCSEYWVTVLRDCSKFCKWNFNFRIKPRSGMQKPKRPKQAWQLLFQQFSLISLLHFSRNSLLDNIIITNIILFIKYVLNC